MPNESTTLFKPLKVGSLLLSHRIVLAPLTRFRALENHAHSAEAITYYSQRACVPGTLLITEATYISAEAGGYPNVPGIYNAEQVAAWKKITDAVHAKGSYIYVQLWALGRAAVKNVVEAEGGEVVSASDIPIDEQHATPRPLTIGEIEDYVKQYTAAAKLAIEAGFDGVEVHGANGFLPDQFLQDVSNRREDKYGGSVENRSRFLLEIVNACVEAVGADRVGVRISPWSQFQSMRMKDWRPQFTHLVTSLPRDLAYVHIIEEKKSGDVTDATHDNKATDFLKNLWEGPVFAAGSYQANNSIELTGREGNENVAVAVGRYFISNPDIVAKIKLGLELTKYNRDTFYSKYPDFEGYTDYLVDEEVVEKASKL